MSLYVSVDNVQYGSILASVDLNGLRSFFWKLLELVTLEPLVGPRLWRRLVILIFVTKSYLGK